MYGDDITFRIPARVMRIICADYDDDQCGDGQSEDVDRLPETLGPRQVRDGRHPAQLHSEEKDQEDRDEEIRHRDQAECS